MWVKTRVENKEYLPGDVVHLFLSRPGFTYKPGQFVIVRATVGGEEVKRAYSIASHPSWPTFELLIKKVGKMSSHLYSLGRGEEVEVAGPFGHFTLDRARGNRILLVSMGVGIAPMRPLAYEALERGWEAVLVQGNKRWEEIPFRDELISLSSREEKFTFVPVLSREDRAEVARGHVQNVVPRFLEWATDVYICGSREMVDDVRRLVEKGGFEGNVVWEGF